MKLKLDPFFVFWICLMCALGFRNWTAAFLAAAAVHEMGHLLMLHIFRQPVPRLRVGFLGAGISITAMPPGKELICTLAGPAANLVFALAFVRIWFLFSLCCLLLLLYNMLPVFPLDGGRVLEIMLNRFLRADLSQRICTIVGCCVCIGILFGSFYLSLVCKMGLWPIFAACITLLRLALTAAACE